MFISNGIRWNNNFSKNRESLINHKEIYVIGTFVPRSAEAEPEAKAEADPWLAYGYAGYPYAYSGLYHGYAGYHAGYPYAYYGKRLVVFFIRTRRSHSNLKAQ